MVEPADSKVNGFASDSSAEVTLTAHVQGLACLLTLGRVIETVDGIEEVCHQVPDILVEGLQRDAVLSVRVTLGPFSCVSSEFRSSTCLVRRKILTRHEPVGEIEVHADSRSMFEASQSYLVDAVAERLGRFYERKGLQAALERSEERFKRLFEQARDGTVLVDAETGLVIDANASFLNMVGLTGGEIRSRKIWEVLPTRKQTGALEEFSQLASDPERRRVAIPVRTVGGAVLDLEVSCSALQFAHHKVFQIVCRDVTERQELMRRLRDSEMRYRAIFDSTPVAMVLCDTSGTVLDVNACLISRFFADKVTKQDLLGKDTLDLGLCDPDKFRREFQWFKDGLCVQLREVPIPESEYRPAGYVDVRCIPLVNEQGETEGGVVFLEDITEIREAQRAMIQSAKMAAVGQMTSGFAHEIGTPLGIISANAQYLLQGKEEAGREELHVILSETKRITNLIRQLLIFSRPAKFDLLPTQVNDLIREVLTLIISQDISRGVDIETDLSPEIPGIRLEPTLIKQVFLNLVINACQATLGDGRLTISSRAEASPSVGGHRAPHAVIVFEDDGMGISQANLKKIFTPFFSTKDVGKGTGLGLSVSYRIIQNHGGTIVAESPGEGQGARFSVYLPLSGHSASESAADKTLKETADAAGGVADG